MVPSRSSLSFFKTEDLLGFFKTELMKNIQIILLVFTTLFISTYSLAQDDSKATGEWILQHIEHNGKEEIVGQIVDFNIDGNLYIQEMPFGKWTYNKKEQRINIDTTEDISGSYAVTFNADNKMQLSLDAKKLIFSKIDRATITKDNSQSGFIGVWELEKEQDPNAKKFFTFNAPDTFTLFEKEEGMESNSKGMWIFNKKENSLLLIGQVGELRGFNKLIKVTKEQISIENNGKSYTLKKVVQNAIKIERLTFTSADFYDENGDYKYYNDAGKLPWQDLYQMIDYLSNVKQLVYQFSTLIDNTKSFESKTLTANVEVNQEEETLSIDYIFNGYDRYNLPEDTALQPNKYDGYSKLFPYKDEAFRVVGEKEITTPAGVFTCTLVELVGSFDEKVKLYMIKDKPGVIAKIIKDKSGTFGHYHTYELKEIK